MARQSISLNEPNDLWLQQQVHSQEYSSKSEVINDLIRQERFRQQQLDNLRTRLIQAEQSGFSEENKNEILIAARSQNANL
ncbi:MAG: type II toxin-antitoxin system ParD family antitoxin [Sphingobacteriaceae bacterium]|nr:type II toxin-antitoxin system ParD family antitoxin [Sphingobacteriaceae bacterium]